MAEKPPDPKVGISIDDYQPIDITRDRNRYQGISADYLSLVGERLGTSMEVLGFSEREQAVEALRNGTIDVLTSANGYERGAPGLRFTSDYMPDLAVVVVRRDEPQPSDDLAGKKVVLLDATPMPPRSMRLIPTARSCFHRTSTAAWKR